MKSNLLYISLITISLCCFSCKKTDKSKSLEELRNEKIESAVRNSNLFENSDLSDFKDFEEIEIDYKDLPSYKLTLDDIKSSNELIEEAREKKNKEEAYIEILLDRIKLDEDRLQYLKEKTTSVMYRVKFREDMKMDGKHFLTTHAQAYINHHYEVIDFIH